MPTNSIRKKHYTVQCIIVWLLLYGCFVINAGLLIHSSVLLLIIPASTAIAREITPMPSEGVQMSRETTSMQPLELHEFYEYNSRNAIPNAAGMIMPILYT